MGDVEIGTRVRIGGELSAQDSSNIYDDPKILKAAWSWIKLYLEGKEEKREIAAIEAALKERQVFEAVHPNTPVKAPSGSSLSFSGDTVTVPESVLRRHTLIFGSSGYGKTFFAHLMISQMLEQGCSLIAIDPKPETLKRLRGACEEAGVHPSNVVMIDASEQSTIPAFNPFRSGEEPEEIVRLFMDWMRQDDDANAPRMWKFLRNALVIVAWHGLRPQDILRILSDESYRNGILRQEPLHEVDATYITAESFFLSEYLKYKPSERDSSVGSLDTRLDELLGNKTFQKMMNAPENTLDMGRMFSEQRVVLISTGSAGGMTRSSINMLVSFVLHMVNSAAAKRSGNVPLVMYMDEVATQNQSIKEELSKIANLARERNIRLILAAQHPYQFSDQLRRDVMSSSALKAYFHNDEDGAEKVASVLAGGQNGEDAPPPPPRIISIGKPVPIFTGQLYAARGNSNYLSALEETDPNPSLPEVMVVDPEDPGPYIKAFAYSDAQARPPICFQDGHRFAPSVRGLPKGSVLLSWHNKKAGVIIQLPLMAVYKEPAKSTRPSEYWLRTIKTLPVGRAVVVVGNEDPLTMDVTTIEPPSDANPRYIDVMRKHTAAPDYRPVRLTVPPKLEPDRHPGPIPVLKTKITPKGEDDDTFIE
ncbi:MAG: DUF87 domain-containing protein [Armatimonas sp.]